MATDRANLQTAPEASIIICTYNRAALLERTLRSLVHLAGIEEAEVIVVDNGSPDGTAAAVERCAGMLQGRVRLSYVHEPRQGLSVARNTGIARARAPLLAFLDDDAVPEPGWLAAIRRAFAEHPRAGAAGGPVLPEFAAERPDWLAGRLELPFTIVDLGPGARRWPRRLHPFGANMAIRRAALDGVSGIAPGERPGAPLRFPEALGRKGTALYSGEESWLFSRLRRQGWSLVYVPDMRVRHHIPAERLSEAWIRKRYYYQGLSMAKACTGAAGRIRLAAGLALRRLYIAVQARLAGTPAKRLWAECRRETVRGAWHGLKGGDAHAG